MDRTTSTDREAGLLAEVARGDREAFRELYDLTARSVYFFLYRMVQEEALAEDLQVEVFAQVWKGADRFQGRSKVKTWILGIARNLAMNALRKRRYHLDIDDCHGLADETLPDPDAADRKRCLGRAMTELSDKHREVLDLVFYQQMNYNEIGELLSVSVNTVKTRVFYAKDALKKALERMGVGKDEI